MKMMKEPSMMRMSIIFGRFQLIISLIFFTSVMFNHIDMWAQGSFIWNSADRDQAWVSDINPAVISYQDARVSLGLKVFHLGFLPDKAFGLRESHINASFPFYLPYELGIGCDMRYFSAGAYSEAIGSVMLSKEVVDRFSLGMKIGLMRSGFDRADFVLVDVNDPLVGGDLWKTKLNFGIGAYWNPNYWTIGLGIDHINRPDIGFQTQAILPLEISAAIGYRFRRFTPTFLIQKDGMGFRYGLGVTVTQNRLGLLSFSYETGMPFKMEAQINLSSVSSLRYVLDLPNENMHTVSTGSHELIFNYIFDQGPDIARPKILLSSKSMTVTEETVIRSMPSNLSPIEVENMGEVAPEYLSTKRKLHNLLIVKTGALNQYETKLIRHKRYTQLAKGIMHVLQQNPDVQLILRADDGSLKDARAFKQYLLRKKIIDPPNIGLTKMDLSGEVKLVGFETGQEIKSSESPSFSADKLTINFTVPGNTRRVQNWKLTITDTRKNIVKTYSGKEKLPEQLEWDWRNKWGELVPSGQYICILTLRSVRGRKRASVSQQLAITHIKRTTTLRFRREPQMLISKIHSTKD